MGIFLVSYVLYLTHDKAANVMRKRDFVILYVMAVVIGFCKILYFPLILLYLIIPEERFGSKKQKYIHIGVIFGITLVLNLIWLIISSGFLIEFMLGVDSKGQIIYIYIY